MTETTDRDSLREFARSVGLAVVVDGMTDTMRRGGAFVRVVYLAGDRMGAAFFNGIIVADDMRMNNTETVKSWIATLSSRLPTRK